MSPSNQPPIAIVGMACRLPGANNLDQYWEIIRDRKSEARPLPKEVFDRERYFCEEKGVRHKSYSEIGCLIDYSYRGPLHDQLPERVRNHPELTYRVICEVAAEAAHNAGLDWKNQSRNGGVYIGHTRSSGLSSDLGYSTHAAELTSFLEQSEAFQKLPPDTQNTIIQQVIDDIHHDMPKRDERGGPNIGASVASAEVAKTLRLTGPYMTFNSACASSLHALVQGVRALQHGRIDMAVVGGASYAHRDTFILFSQAQSLTNKLSRPFDDEADGLVVGEGCVILILKTLEQAIQAGDRIHGVISSLGISADGKGKSLWAPRHEGQIEAIRRAHGGSKPKEIQYIEAHATSTQVGDATEIRALSEALTFSPGVRIPLGSVKANIGHTLECAGLSGLLKTLLCLKHQQIPAATNLQTLNRNVPWHDIPFYVPKQAQPWPAPGPRQPRRAAVNSFGIGGLNVHILVEEHLSASVAPMRPAQSFPSARNGSPAPRRPSTAGTPDDLAIVGMGTVLPGALNLTDFLQRVEFGEDPKDLISARHFDWQRYVSSDRDEPWKIHSALCGEVRGFAYDWRKHKVPPKQIANASPLQFMILEAVDAAFQEAGIDLKSFDRKKIGVIVGNTFGGEFGSQLQMGLRIPDFQMRLRRLLGALRVPEEQIEAIAEQYEENLLRKMPALLDETGSFTSSSLVTRITKSFDLMGGGVAVDAGPCSSGAALMCSADLLQSNDCDMMVCVGSQENLTVTCFEAMSRAGVLTSNPRSPFDTAANGFVPGEGCAVVLLMRLDDARRRGMNIWGIIRGIGAAQDEHVEMASRLAAERAIARGQQSSQPISAASVVRVHSTSNGVPPVCLGELKGLADVYRPFVKAKPIEIDSSTPQFGHLGSAAGLVSVVKAAAELRDCQASRAFAFSKPLPELSQLPFQVVPTPHQLSPVNFEGRLVCATHETNSTDSAFHILMERGSKVSSPVKHTPIQPITNSVQEFQLCDGIPHYDATLRRKAKLREKATSRNGTTAHSNDIHKEEPKPSRPEIAIASPPASPEPQPGNPASPSPSQSGAASAWSRAELEQFLVNFVVEQTGYPPEIVEMDVDLEADLGIDSIKKAQLFGELREHFDIEPNENMTLDDFPTLRSMADFLLSGSASTTPVASAMDAAPQNVSPVGSAEDVSSTNNATPPAPHSSEVAASSTSGGSAWSRAELEQFLVNFVVEQTGYPPEIVEMDVDLEADLGIDSIKKAQLFGELREHFDIEPNENMTLDDFPTLRSMADFLMAAEPTNTATSTSVPNSAAPPVAGNTTMAEPAPTAPSDEKAQSGWNTQELEQFLVNFVVEQTGYPPEIVEMDVDLEADLGIDSIKKAQLFGELREHFDIEPNENMTLDDFPTLRHIHDFIGKQVILT